MSEQALFAEVLFPLALDASYTYIVPEGYETASLVGKRVLAPLGPRKWYAGLVVAVHSNKPPYRMKAFRRVLDESPIVTSQQIELWRWTSEYYMCSMGEVMKAALPGGLRLDAYQHEEEISDAQWDEIVQAAYKPLVREYYFLNEDQMQAQQQKLMRSKAKMRLMAWCIQFNSPLGFERRTLLEGAGINASILKSCTEMGLLRMECMEQSRLDQSAQICRSLPVLSKGQQKAMDQIEQAFEERSVVLLHGVTSSGKTEVYIRLMEKCLSEGKRVLYLVPEIALTAQLIQRLKAVFGNKVGVYHSRFSDEERVEVYLAQNGNGMIAPYQVLLGVRSSVFLPYEDLGLVIVDEEHENSYKQYDPAPRYNARDLSIILASGFGAKVLLGSATPAVESYQNALQGKYGLVELHSRYGAVDLPEIELVDMMQARKNMEVSAHFSHRLLSEIRQAVENGEQVVLFQNRRGYSPYLECPECGYVPTCTACNVKLTYHKNDRQLVCHYCGQVHPVLHLCPHCKITAMELKGYGTERIEDELLECIPSLRIGRMDLDATRSRDAFQKIVADFENHELDVLVGTQMITKGLDFSRLSLVGVINADNLLYYPDFRSSERSYQLLSQVAGRAGRRKKKGRVLIQTSQPSHQVLQQVLKQDYTSMFRSQLEERADFMYPPFVRLIHITLKHRNESLLVQNANRLAQMLRHHLPAYVLGPEKPIVDKIQHYYLRSLLIKIPRETSLREIKTALRKVIEAHTGLPEGKSLKIILDVDPL